MGVEDWDGERVMDGFLKTVNPYVMAASEF